MQVSAQWATDRSWGKAKKESYKMYVVKSDESIQIHT